MSTCEPVRLASSVFLRSTSRCLRSAVSRASAMRRPSEARLVFRLANSVRTEASRASACVTLMRNGSGSISISGSPAFTRWPSVTVTLAILPEMSGVMSTFCAPT